MNEKPEAKEEMCWYCFDGLHEFIDVIDELIYRLRNGYEVNDEEISDYENRVKVARVMLQHVGEGLIGVEEE